MEEKNTADRAS